MAGQLHLPQDKPVRLQVSIHQHSHRSTPYPNSLERDLLSLISLLHHAMNVVRLGCAFQQNLINTAMDHYICTPLLQQLRWTFAGGTLPSPVEWNKCPTSGVTIVHSAVRCFELLGLWGSIGDNCSFPSLREFANVCSHFRPTVELPEREVNNYCIIAL